MRSSRNTSVYAASALTESEFCPSPPLRSSTMCRSCDALPSDAASQLALMFVRKRCFLTVAYSRCSESNAVTAGRPWRASAVLLPAWYIRSSDGLACSRRKPQSSPALPVYVSNGSDDVEPSSNGARASTNCDSASTSDVRNWQSPLKSPHTCLLHGAHACNRRAAEGRPCAASCHAAVSGPTSLSVRRRETRLTYPRPATTATYCSSVLAPEPSCTTMFVTSPSISATPLPNTFRRTVPSVI